MWSGVMYPNTVWSADLLLYGLDMLVFDTGIGGLCMESSILLGWESPSFTKV